MTRRFLNAKEIHPTREVRLFPARSMNKQSVHNMYEKYGER